MESTTVPLPTTIPAESESSTGYIVATVLLTILIAASGIVIFFQLRNNRKLRQTLDNEKKPGKADQTKLNSYIEKNESKSENEKPKTRESQSESEQIKPETKSAVKSNVQVKFSAIPLKQDVLPQRNSKQVVGDISSETFVRLVRKVLPFITESRDHPEQYDANAYALPGFLYNVLPSTAPEKPCTFDEILDDFKSIVFPGMNQWHHPRFFGWITMGRSYPDMLGEVFVSALGAFQKEWIDNPSLAELEVVVMNWVGRAFGLPESFLFHGNSEKSTGGGVFTEGASESIFIAVLAARTKAINRVLHETKEVPEDEHFLYANKNKAKPERVHEICSKLVVYASEEAHSSIEKGATMAAVRFHGIKNTTATDYSMTAAKFEEAVLKDKAKGLIPCMVMVSIGTTSSSEFDHLEDIANVATKHGMWIHVDGAYGGSSWIDPKHRGSQKGLHLAHSIDINLHKLLLHSITTSLLWTSDQASMRAAYYNKNENTSIAHDVCDWGIHDKRREKALKVWLSFRLFGTERLKEYVNRCLQTTEYIRSLMLQHPNIRMFGQQKMALFCFQYVEPGMTEDEINEHTDRLGTFLNESKKMIISVSKVGTSNILRINVGYEKICKADMDATFQIFKDMIEYYKNNRNDPCLIKFAPPPLHKEVAVDEDQPLQQQQQQKLHFRETEKVSSVRTSPSSKSPMI